MSTVQRIDLFHSGLRPARVPLQFRDLQLTCAGLLALCLVSGALRLHGFYELRAERADAERQLEALNAAGVQLRAAVGGDAMLTLKEDIKRLQAVQRAQRELLGLLNEGAKQQQQVPFSVQLEELARQSLDGVWLTRIHLDAAARTVALYGRAEMPVLVPELLQSLSRASAYQGYEFDRFEIAETEEGDHRFAIVGPAAELP